MELLRLSLVFGLMFNLNRIQPSSGQDDSALAEEYFHNFFRPGRDPGFFGPLQISKGVNHTGKSKQLR